MVIIIVLLINLHYLKGDKLILKGITTGGGSGVESEDLSTATGGTTQIMSGFNANLFTNGDYGYNNRIPGGNQELLG